MNIPSLATTLHRVFSSFSRTEPQVNTIPDKVDDMSVSQGFTAGSAQAEGWDVFECGVREDGSTCREIQRLDSPRSASRPSPMTGVRGNTSLPRPGPVRPCIRPS